MSRPICGSVNSVGRSSVSRSRRRAPRSRPWAASSLVRQSRRSSSPRCQSRSASSTGDVAAFQAPDDLARAPLCSSSNVVRRSRVTSSTRAPRAPAASSTSIRCARLDDDPRRAAPRRRRARSRSRGRASRAATARASRAAARLERRPAPFEQQHAARAAGARRAARAARGRGAPARGRSARASPACARARPGARRDPGRRGVPPPSGSRRERRRRGRRAGCPARDRPRRRRAPGRPRPRGRPLVRERKQILEAAAAAGEHDHVDRGLRREPARAWPTIPAAAPRPWTRVSATTIRAGGKRVEIAVTRSPRAAASLPVSSPTARGEARQRALALGREEPLGGRAPLEPLERGEVLAEPETLDRGRPERQLALRLVEAPRGRARVRARRPRARGRAGRSGRRSIDAGRQAPVCGSLSVKNTLVPSGVAAELGHLALDPELREAGDVHSDAAVERRHRVDLAVAVLLRFDLRHACRAA